MITGSVNAYREAIIRISILNSTGQPYDFDAIVDTGFNGSLTLPSVTIAALGLAWRTRGSAILANGLLEECDIYSGVAVWDGQSRTILIESAETDPLIGMRLMQGYRIIIEDIDGGDVKIERI